MRKSKRFNPNLMEAIGFSDEDLEANRKDAISKRQATYLRRKTSKWLDLFALVLVLGIMVGVYAISDGTAHFLPIGDIAGRAVVIIIITLALLLFIWLMRSSELLAIEKQEVELLEGRVHLYIFSGKSSVIHRVEIEGISFAVSHQTFDAFDDGEYYRIYYSPVTKTILSAERIYPGQPRPRPKLVIRKAKTNWSPLLPPRSR